MIEKIKKIISLEEFKIEQGLEKVSDFNYGNSVANLCNNACAFIYLSFLDKLPNNELSLFEIHNGYYDNNFIKHQHSWLVYKPENKIIDLTLVQFDKKYEMFYVGNKPPELFTKDIISCDDLVNISSFFKEL
jgi:hypothetical protein